MGDERYVCVTAEEFEAAYRRAFRFLEAEYAFASPLFWQFAGTLYASHENDHVRVVTWCPTTDSDVWTYIQRVEDAASLGLDTVEAFGRRDETEYPHGAGEPWSPGELDERLALEARLLRTYAGDLLRGDLSLVDKTEGPVGEAARHVDAVRVDDLEERFGLECMRRFRFLETEYGLEPELAGMGSTVVFRNDDAAAVFELLDTANEDEDEAAPQLSLRITPIIDGLVPPLWDDVYWAEFEYEREGPFTREYLDASFARAERDLRQSAGYLRHRVGT